MERALLLRCDHSHTHRHQLLMLRDHSCGQRCALFCQRDHMRATILQVGPPLDEPAILQAVQMFPFVTNSQSANACCEM